MISYELALELKNAGFPQKGIRNEWYFVSCESCQENHPETPSRLILPKDTNEYLDSAEGLIKIPTLEELISACGFDFRDLSQHTSKTLSGQPRWIAKGGIRVFGTGKWRLFNGRTPEEAVSRLWISMNKKPTQ